MTHSRCGAYRSAGQILQVHINGSKEIQLYNLTAKTTVSRTDGIMSYNHTDMPSTVAEEDRNDEYRQQQNLEHSQNRRIQPAGGDGIHGAEDNRKERTTTGR